jgi:copper resistance protein D
MDPDSLIIPVRAVHFAAVLVLLGTVLFRLRLATPRVAAALSGRLLAWERWTSMAALVSGLAWLLAETAIAGDGWSSATDPATVLALAAGTTFGRVWCGRLLLCGILVALTSAPGRQTGRWLQAGAAGLAFSLGWAGHGVMLDGLAGTLAAAGLGVHVMAASTWAGALPAVALCVSQSGLEVPLEAGAESLRRFSRAGHLAVVLTVVTGASAAHSILQDWRLDLSVPYQQLLAVKIGLVAAMIGLALVNGYGMLPGFGQGGPTSRRRLLASSCLEIAAAGLVLALVAAFGTLSPSG